MRRLTRNVFRDELDLRMFQLLPVCLQRVTTSFRRFGQTGEGEHDRLPLQMELVLVVAQLDCVLCLVQNPARLAYLVPVDECPDL